MELHNMCEITVGKNTYISFNTMLPSLNQFLLAGENYSKYFALGTGTSETTGDMTTLEKCVMVCKSEFVDLIPDVKNRDYYLIKRCEVNEDDDNYLEFTELGLTPYGDMKSPPVVNRFILNGGNPIVREPGEKMTITIKIVLSFSSTGSAYNLVEGDNILVRWLLGVDEIKNRTFTLARGGTGDVGTTERFDWTPVVTEEYPTTADVGVDDSGHLYINLSANMGTNLGELLVLLNGEVVLRQGSDSIRKETGALTTEQKICDGLGAYSFLLATVTRVDGAKYPSPAHDVTRTIIQKYPSGWKSDVENVTTFDGIDFSQGIYVSKDNARRVCFRVDNGARVFKIKKAGGEFSEFVATSVDLTDAVGVFLMDNHIYVRYQNDETGSRGVRHYAEINGTYYEKPLKFKHIDDLAVNPEDVWQNVDMDKTIRSGDEKFYHYMVVMTTARLVMYQIDYKADGSAEVVGFTDYGDITGSLMSACRSFNGEIRIIVRQCNKGNNKIYMVCNEDRWEPPETTYFLGSDIDAPGYPQIRYDRICTFNKNTNTLVVYFYVSDRICNTTIDARATYFYSHDGEYMIYKTSTGTIFTRHPMGNQQVMVSPTFNLSTSVSLAFADVWGEYMYVFSGDGSVVRRRMKKERNKVHIVSEPFRPTLSVSYHKGEVIGDGEVTASVKMGLIGSGEY